MSGAAATAGGQVTAGGSVVGDACDIVVIVATVEGGSRQNNSWSLIHNKINILSLIKDRHVVRS